MTIFYYHSGPWGNLVHRSVWMSPESVVQFEDTNRYIYFIEEEEN